MANIDQIRRILNQNDEQGKNLLIIASVDDQQKILSCLSPTKSEPTPNFTDLSSTDQQTDKRLLIQFESQNFVQDVKLTNTKKRKGDLTCVICEGSASGYNFNQITCESCKAFFRRNALQSIEKTKCLTRPNNFNEILCPIRFDIKNKCQRCRLLKCFQSGMNKGHILTNEEKLLKQQRLEENRRLRSTQTFNSPTKIELFPPVSQTTNLISVSLTEDDQNLLNYINYAYQIASQSTPPYSSVVQIELAPDRASAYLNTLDIQNYAALKLIHFIKSIKEFEQLNEDDRLTLVKYNLNLLMIVRYTETFDPTRDLLYLDPPTTGYTSSDEALAHHNKSLFILCYGYEFNCVAMSIFHDIYKLIDHDSTITQLLILNMIFLKGLSITDGQESLLNDSKAVFLAHSKYTDLIFRYLMEKSSYEFAAIKIMRITEVFIKIQRLMRDFQQFIRDKVDVDRVNPLMKSILNLT